MRLDAQVIVVGGGPAGSSTAWHLACAGVDVLLLDRATFPRDKPCSEYLSPQASRILSNMNVLDAIEQAGAAQLTGMQVTSPNGTIMHGEFSADHGFKGFRDEGLAIRRTILDSKLLDSARSAGVKVMEQIRVTDTKQGRGIDGFSETRVSATSVSSRVSEKLSTHGRGVSVLHPDGKSQELSAQIVIGADGLRSIIARRLGLARRSRLFTRLALVTHYRGISELQSYGEMHVARNGYMGIADVGNGEANVAVVVPASRGADIAASKAEFLEEWIASQPHIADRFRNAERTTPVHATGPFAVKAKRAWAPRAALVGDAADFFDPFTGEGIYAALRGGELLAPYIVESLNGSDSPLAEYDRARKIEFGGKWKVERLIGAAVAFPFVMNHVGRVLSKRKDMADMLVGVVGDFVPAREVLRPGYMYNLLFS